MDVGQVITKLSLVENLRQTCICVSARLYKPEVQRPEDAGTKILIYRAFTYSVKIHDFSHRIFVMADRLSAVYITVLNGRLLCGP